MSCPPPQPVHLHPARRLRVSTIVPCWNDAYTLRLCLESIAGVVAEVIVVDDASTDDSARVIAQAAQTFGNIKSIRTSRIGCIEARNLGMALAAHDDLMFLDADDVFCGNLEELRRAVASPCYLGLINLYGDLHHREIPIGSPDLHHDVCHLTVNRGQLPDFHWRSRDGDLGMFETNDSMDQPRYRRSPLLFWHLHGVKPDERLIGRHSAFWEPARARFNRPAPTLAGLLRSVQLEKIGKTHPWYPAVLRTHDRFLIQYDAAGRIIGRRDLEHPASSPTA